MRVVTSDKQQQQATLTGVNAVAAQQRDLCTYCHNPGYWKDDCYKCTSHEEKGRLQTQLDGHRVCLESPAGVCGEVGYVVELEVRIHYVSLMINCNKSILSIIRTGGATPVTLWGILQRIVVVFSLSYKGRKARPHQVLLFRTCSPLWGGCRAVALRQLDKIQYRAIRLFNNPGITQDFPPIFVWRDTASLALLYRYFYCKCSEEMASIVAPIRIFPCSTRQLYMPMN